MHTLWRDGEDMTDCIGSRSEWAATERRGIPRPTCCMCGKTSDELNAPYPKLRIVQGVMFGRRRLPALMYAGVVPRHDELVLARSENWA